MKKKKKFNHQMQDYLKKEIKKQKNKEDIRYLEHTLEYLIQQDEELQQEWKRFASFFHEEVERFNQDIQELGLNASVVDWDFGDEHHTLKIELSDCEGDYTGRGVLDVSKYADDSYSLESTFMEKDVKSISSLKKQTIEAFKSKEIKERCLVIANRLK